MFNNFSQKSCHLQDNAEKYGRTRQATNKNIIQHMYIACWITNAKDTTYSEYVKLITFPGQQWLCKQTSMLHLHVHCLSC
jgi:hypothetical protein